MLQLIGLSVMSYAGLRCLSFATRSGDRAEHGLVRALSVCCFLLQALLACWLLLTDVATKT